VKVKKVDRQFSRGEKKALQLRKERMVTGGILLSLEGDLSSGGKQRYRKRKTSKGRTRHANGVENLDFTAELSCSGLKKKRIGSQEKGQPRPY